MMRNKLEPRVEGLERRAMLSAGHSGIKPTAMVHAEKARPPKIRVLHHESALTGLLPRAGDPPALASTALNPGNFKGATVVLNTHPSPFYPYVDTTYVGSIQLHVGGRVYNPTIRENATVTFRHVNVKDDAKSFNDGIEVWIGGPAVDKIPPGALLAYYRPSISVDYVYDALGRLRVSYAGAKPQSVVQIEGKRPLTPIVSHRNFLNGGSVVLEPGQTVDEMTLPNPGTIKDATVTLHFSPNYVMHHDASLTAFDFITSPTLVSAKRRFAGAIVGNDIVFQHVSLKTNAHLFVTGMAYIGPPVQLQLDRSVGIHGGEIVFKAADGRAHQYVY